MAVVSTYFDQFLNGKPTVYELYEHVRVGTNWYKLGVLLKLDITKLNDIRLLNEDSDFKSLKMFELWLSSKPSATRKEIIETLKKPAIGENTVAEQYKETLRENLDEKEVATLLLQKHSECLTHLIFPSKIVRMLYAEEVISMETLNAIEGSGSLQTDSSLRALSNTVSEDPNKLRVFASVLLQSEETVHVGKVILKEYNEQFPQEIPVQPSQPNTNALSTSALNNHLTIPTQSATTELYLPATFEYSFDQMRATFGKLIHTVAPLIKSAIISLPSLPEPSLLENCLPLEELKLFLKRCFEELKPQLSIAKSFDDIMDIVQEKCTIINIACLETVIDHYNIEEAKAHITAYKSMVDKFCEEVKLSVCKDKDFMSSPSSLLKHETIEFVLEWEPDSRSLYQIKVLLRKAFQDIAKFVQVRYIKEGNSIIVTCYAPQNIMHLLLMEAQKNLHNLIKMGVIKLTITFHTIWDERSRDKEVRGLVDEVRTLEEKVVFQRKALAEIDQVLINLKSFLKETSLSNIAMIRKSPDALEQLLPKQKDKPIEENPLKHENRPIVSRKQENDNKLEDVMVSKNIAHSMKTTNKEGPPDQSSTNTLSEKLKLLDRMNKAKTLEIEKLTRHKEATDKVLVDRQEEIGILQEKITSLTLQLMEREEKNSQLMENIKALQSQVVQLRDQIKDDDSQFSQMFEEVLASRQEPPLDDKLTQEEPDDRVDDIARLSLSDHKTKDSISQRKDKVISQLTGKDVDEDDSQQESLDGKELPKDTESVKWTSSSVILTSSTVTECKEVMHQLTRRQHTTWEMISLKSLSPESLLTLLTDINECRVKALYIRNTNFDSNCVNQLSHVVTYNETMEDLSLISSPLLPDTYQLLTTALTKNKNIKRLDLYNDKNISDKDIPHLCHLINNNETLKVLSLRGCGKITKFGIRQIENVLVKNNSLSSVYINDNYIRSRY